MHDTTGRIAAILDQYASAPGEAISLGMSVGDLQIDPADVPLIILDIEDAFDIQIGYSEVIDRNTTLAELVIAAQTCVEAKAARPRAAVPRSKRPWMVTEA